MLATCQAQWHDPALCLLISGRTSEIGLEELPSWALFTHSGWSAMILKNDCKILLVVSEPAPISIASMCSTCSLSSASSFWIYARLRISYIWFGRAEIWPYLQEHLSEAFWGAFRLHRLPQDIQDSRVQGKVSALDCHGLVVPGLKEER